MPDPLGTWPCQIVSGTLIVAMMSPGSMSKEAALTQLLTSLFADGELSQIALYALGEEIHRELPHQGSLQTLAFEVMRHAQRHNRIPALFSAIRESRSQRRADVEQVERLWSPNQAPVINSIHPITTSRATVPKPSYFVGRDVLANDLVQRLQRDPVKPIAIMGPGGIGKSTLAMAVLDRLEIKQRFPDARHFVRLDESRSVNAALALIAQSVGAQGQSPTIAELQGAIAAAPTLLVLDNFETPWEHDRAASEALLSSIGALPGVALIVTMRGAKRPDGLAWDRTIHVKRLNDDEGLKLFYAIADFDVDSDSSPIRSLIAELEGVPLAIKLLAHQAEGVPIAAIIAQWKSERTAMLRHAGMTSNRLTDWAMSVALSFDSPRMTEPAKRLASIMARLPDGIAINDVHALMPKEWSTAVSVLTQVGLAWQEDDRLCMLAPVRDHLRANYALGYEDWVIARLS